MTDTKPNGLLVIDKPGGMTSRAVVNRVQNWLPPGTRIGHTGTLDPLATGVLVSCIGIATRLVEYVQDMDKTYVAGLLLGATSNTDDADGDVQTATVVQPPSLDTIASCLQSFVGEIDQVPPQFSAAKVSGRRAHALARKGRVFDLAPRKIQIYEISVLSYSFPHLEIEVRCGKGTYIRSLARDLGSRLGCGGLVQTLRRTRVGPFEVRTAIGLDCEQGVVHSQLLPLEMATTNLPRIVLGEVELKCFRQGKRVSPPCQHASIDPRRSQVAVHSESGQLAGIGTLEGSKLVPEKVLSLEK